MSSENSTSESETAHSATRSEVETVNPTQGQGPVIENDNNTPASMISEPVEADSDELEELVDMFKNRHERKLEF